MNETAPWLILFLPLLASVVITLFLQRKPGLAAMASVGAALISFVLTLVLLAQFLNGRALDVSATWLQAGALHIDFGLHFDALSFIMLLIVAGVGSLIHIYSVGYMRGDPCYGRFFACMSLFIFSMLGIVLSNNFFQMFVFWELVGLSSYLLIGFWHQKSSAADAAKKAFLCNRLGDFGFFAGIVLIWAAAGTLNFKEINPALFGTAATAAGLLIFCGTVGKSAQFPLHVWLPDAMEGPTPVSALIHAATMVAAGVYMLCRVFFIFTVPSLQVIAWIGGITALLSALIAVQQDDIKRILAYSTISQLGYMVMAVGFAAPPAAMFHLATHAFFKALLFLGAGSVIHAMSQEQDIWKMGALRHKMPVTYWTFLAATLAIGGMPPLSGFYSKDAILAAAWEHDKALFAIGVFVAFLTTFYMFRLFFVVFLGQAKSDAVSHAHESPPVMTVPLLILAALSIIGGFIGINHFIAPQFSRAAAEVPIFAPFEPFKAAPGAAALGLAAFVLGLFGAFLLYAGKRSDPIRENAAGLSRLMRDKFYFDEFYAKLVALFHDTPAAILNLGDQAIKLLVRLVHGAVEWTGRVLRLIQTGNLQTYTLLMAAGAALALYFILTH
ncbi:MAG TPA: NADH-quinone oxidoreductase subunit L [Verrucomicrobiae bacterium]|jgi:NADH-quinone oxidoreductase subunit L